jgi:hypothetical protein
MSTEIVGAIANAVTAAAAVAAARFAWLGLQTWRHEMLGRRKAEMAEDVLATVYEARDVFHWVRNPGGFAGEAEARPRADGEDEDLARRLDACFVPIARLNDNRPLLSGLHAKRYRFRALFGQGSDQPLQVFREVEAEIVTAANALTRLALNEARRSGRAVSTRMIPDHVVEQEHARRMGAEARIWDSGEPDDAINRRLDEAVAEIERICRPAIEARAR